MIRDTIFYITLSDNCCDNWFSCACVCVSVYVCTRTALVFPNWPPSITFSILYPMFFAKGKSPWLKTLNSFLFHFR